MLKAMNGARVEVPAIRDVVVAYGTGGSYDEGLPDRDRGDAEPGQRVGGEGGEGDDPSRHRGAGARGRGPEAGDQGDEEDGSE